MSDSLQPMDCSLSGSSAHEILQSRGLEWAAISFSGGSSWPKDKTQVSHIVGGFFTVWATLGVSVQFTSVTQSCPTLCDPMNHSTPGLPVHQQCLEFTQTHVHWVGDAIQPSHPLVSPSPLPPIPPSIRVFANELTVRIRWPKYWSFNFSISTSSEHPGLISFSMDWLDLAVQGTLKSFLQHHRSAFFVVQLSHPYMTTGKTVALTRWTFVGKVMSLLFKMLSTLVMIFLPRSKCLLISWLQSPTAVILEPPQNKVWHCFHCFRIYLPWSDGTGCHDLSFLNVEL